MELRNRLDRARDSLYNGRSLSVIASIGAGALAAVGVEAIKGNCSTSEAAFFIIGAPVYVLAEKWRQTRGQMEIQSPNNTDEGENEPNETQSEQ
jgi:hypothetical protein